MKPKHSIQDFSVIDRSEGAGSQSSASQDTFDNTFPHRVVDALGFVKLTLQMTDLCLQRPYPRLQFYNVIWSLCDGIRRRQAIRKVCMVRRKHVIVVWGNRLKEHVISRFGWNQITEEPTDCRGRNTGTSLSLPFGSLVRANGWIGRTGMASSLLAPDKTAS